MNFFAISFGILYVGLGKNRISGKNIFFSFSANPIPFWLKILLKKGFLIFGIFLLFFSEFSCPNRVRTEYETRIFFSLSRSISSRFGKKNNAGKSFFLIFWNYLLFFSKFSSPVRVWTEFGTKIFSLFLSLSRPRLYWNTVGMMFFSFLNFLAIFLEMAARLGWERNSGLKFFSLFPGFSQPVLDRNNAG